MCINVWLHFISSCTASLSNPECDALLSLQVSLGRRQLWSMPGNQKTAFKEAKQMQEGNF